MKLSTDGVTLLGDVVASREHSDQRQLLRELDTALSAINASSTPLQPLAITVGDEFQGVFPRLELALRAATLLALDIHGRFDVRVGLGEGELAELDRDRLPWAQSGSAWWRAREALDEVTAFEGRKRWPRAPRARFHGDPQAAGRTALVNAFLLCRDQILERMDETDARIALALFAGRTQSEIGAELGLSQSSISRRQIENGANALYRAHEELARGLRE